MIDLRAVNKNRFALAKRLWMISILLKVSIFVLGSYFVFTSESYRYLPQALLVMAAASELFQWRSDIIKGRSESLLRNLDLCISFGRKISDADKRDIVSCMPKKLRKEMEAPEVVDTYFESNEAPGPRKAVENLVESAWYTRKQTEVILAINLILIVLVLALSTFALMVTSRELENVSTRENINKLVTSWLLLLFSLGLARHAWSYYKLLQRCQKTESNGDHLLGNNEISEADALKQWYEYQITRSASPLLPGWLWKIMEPSLNDAWRRR
jgi:hypothetical protein